MALSSLITWYGLDEWGWNRDKRIGFCLLPQLPDRFLVPFSLLCNVQETFLADKDDQTAPLNVRIQSAWSFTISPHHTPLCRGAWAQRQLYLWRFLMRHFQSANPVNFQVVGLDVYIFNVETTLFWKLIAQQITHCTVRSFLSVSLSIFTLLRISFKCFSDYNRIFAMFHIYF
jgi:hypothetical protein